ncbi:hypothetical protein C490_17751 [Natronobacterium gregoryi SP2]|uniref:Uncharacterized protein n=1 Tax=Natronobacterium gregoryi (strain ATCC 43098 / DSM 3393 / CCM 3738 / CIP 104747 / IAM 13177 / JCM 8860 / NBRC 102187 / NCIMB 2189 / SP2) TaxID=797304 RepID=L9XME9_NATGS|nr:hypothetical protein C490_17751 [Natronobacterium gregoryi SP2]
MATRSPPTVIKSPRTFARIDGLDERNATGHLTTETGTGARRTTTSETPPAIDRCSSGLPWAPITTWSTSCSVA